MGKEELFPDETGKLERTEDINRIDDFPLFDIEEPESVRSFFDADWREEDRPEPEELVKPVQEESAGRDSREDPEDGDGWIDSEERDETAISGGGEEPREPGDVDRDDPKDLVTGPADLETGTEPEESETAEEPEEAGARTAPALPDDSLLMGTDIGQSAAVPSPEADDGSGKSRQKPSGPAGIMGRLKKPGPKKTAGGTDTAGSGEAADVARAVSRAYDDQIRRHRERIRYIRILSAVSVLVVIALIALFFSSRHFNRAEISKVRDFVAEEGSSCVGFDGCILQYGPNGAACADTRGRIKWSITYEMDQPIISISGNVAAIADYGGRTIYVMNTKKQLCTITTGLPIHKVSASESGKVAAVLDDKNTTWIRLYSEKGKEIAYFTRTMEENGYPMDVAISRNGKKICISSLKLKDSSVVSSLSFYDFSKAGKKYDQYMVGSFEYEKEVFPYVRFMGNTACCAASDSRLVVFDTSGTEPKNSFNNMLTETLEAIYECGDRIALVFMDLTRENLFRLDLYGRDGKKEGSIGFSMEFKDIQIKGNRIYINNEQSMQIYTLGGREVFDGGFDRAIKVLIPRWFGRLTAVSVNEIDEVILQ